MAYWELRGGVFRSRCPGLTPGDSALRQSRQASPKRPSTPLCAMRVNGSHLASPSGTTRESLPCWLTWQRPSRQPEPLTCTQRDCGMPGRSSTRAASIAKLVVTDNAMKVTADAVQVLDEAGYTNKVPVERYTRETKVMQIFEGTNQIQRLVIGRDLALAAASV
jgi:hypothetical protein